MITGTLDNWAKSLAIDRRTLERKLAKAGIQRPKSGGTIGAKKIFDLLLQQGLDPVKRLALARAEDQEMDNKVKAGELIRFEEFDAIWTQHQALPLRQWLQSVPSTYDARCNSEHPETARVVLAQLRDDALRLLRDNLPRPEAKR